MQFYKKSFKIPLLCAQSTEKIYAKGKRKDKNKHRASRAKTDKNCLDQNS